MNGATLHGLDYNKMFAIAPMKRLGAYTAQTTTPFRRTQGLKAHERRIHVIIEQNAINLGPDRYCRCSRTWPI